MRIELNLQSDDPSVAPLREAWRRAGQRHRGQHQALAAKARQHYAELDRDRLSPTLVEPLAAIPSLANMLSDPHWQVEDGAREEFAGALAYFIDPDDLIPDQDSRFGYLDDALVLKLALAESRHEWFAWCDYSDYVESFPDEAGIDRATWMQHRRDRLDRDLRKRHDRRTASSFGPQSGRDERPSYTRPEHAPKRFGVR
jgi:hypothetical protein